MIAIIAVTCLTVFAIAALIIAGIRTGPSAPVKQRLDAFQWDARPAQFEDTVTDIRRQEHISGIGWLNRWMVGLNVAPKMRLLLYQADVTTRAETLLLVSVIGWALFGIVIFARTGAVLPSIALSAAFVPVPMFYLLFRRGRRFAKFEQQFPEALDMLVSALKVGHSLATAIGALSADAPEPAAREFRKLFDEQNFGLDLRVAMTNLATRVPLQDVRIFVAAALIQKESGGNLAEVLEKVAHTTRERFRLRRQIRVHAAQGRMTGWVLSILPVVLGFGMYVVNPEGMSVLWTRSAGFKMLCASAAMVLIGCMMIQKIVRIRV